MTKYIIKRIAMGLLSIFIVATLTFFLMNLVPGGPFVAEKSISKAAQEALAAKYGLDKPLFEQYITYITDFIKGDMGVSLRQRGRTVSDIIFSKFPEKQNNSYLFIIHLLKNTSHALTFFDNLL